MNPLYIPLIIKFTDMILSGVTSVAAAKVKRDALVEDLRQGKFDASLEEIDAALAQVDESLAQLNERASQARS